MDEINNNKKISEEEGKNQGLSLKDMWSMCVSRWPWFLISLVVCMTVAIFYILRTPPVYTRTSSVLIKEDRKGRSIAGDIQSSFADLGFAQSNVNVNNEIINFKSPDLMVDVVKRLDLNIDYMLEHRFYDRTLYGSTLPLKVEFLDLGNSESASLDIEPKTDNVYTISNITHNGEKVGKAADMSMGDTLKTAIGRIVLVPSHYHGVAPLDATLHVYRSSYSSAARRYSGSLGVALADKMATVIDLTLNDVNIQRAEDVLNMLVNVYNEKWIKDKNQIVASTNDFIADRLKVIESELGSVDKTISSFKSINLMPDVGAVASMEMQVSKEATRQIMDLNNQLSIARYLQSDIKESRGRLLPADVGLRESSIQGLINQFNTALLQRNRLVETSSEENYLVRDLDRQLEGYREAIMSSIDNYIVGVEMQLSAFRATQATADARISSNPQQAGQLLSDERQQKVKEALYLYLLQKREENELSQAFTAYNTRVVMAPGGGSAPIAPRRAMIYLIAFVLGLAAPFGLIYLLEVSNTTVRGREDLKNMSTPFVGELPSVIPNKDLSLRRIPVKLLSFKDTARKKAEEDAANRKILVKRHSRNMINEAFRVVRTNLEFMCGKGEGGYVIMVTSMNPGSGKTFISSNLSTAFAIKGKKVIAVDLDLRKRSLSGMVEKTKVGLSDYLNGKADDYEQFIIKNVGDNGLDVLPVGTLPPNPAELLAGERLEQLLASLRGKYDYIFLDCPPVEIVTDADIINRLADLTLFVVRAGVLERSLLADIDRFYNTKKYNNLAVILNATDGGGHYGYKYGYRYGYRYGYHYGYGHYGYGSYGYGSDSDKDESGDETKNETKEA